MSAGVGVPAEVRDARREVAGLGEAGFLADRGGELHAVHTGAAELLVFAKVRAVPMPGVFRLDFVIICGAKALLG